MRRHEYRSRTLFVLFHSPEEVGRIDRRLREIAEEYGLVVPVGSRAHEGWIAELLRRIAAGELCIRPCENPNQGGA